MVTVIPIVERWEELETKNIFIVCSKQTSETACSIAQIAACADLNVSLKCENQASCKKATGEIKKIMEAKVTSGELKAEQIDAAMGRIKTTTDLGDAKNADVVIESLFEDEDLKRKALIELDRICAPGAILATNTSAITVTSLARTTSHPERVIGMHFVHFSPIMRVVEIVRGMLTSDDTFAKIEALAKSLGQEIAIAEDAPGLLSTRLWLVYINQAANDVYRKLATSEGLKTLSRTIAPNALSPLESADFLGLDSCIALLQNLYQAYGDLKYFPSPLLTQMVDAGQLGRRSGKGFFNYT